MKNPGRIALRLTQADGNSWTTNFNGDKQDAYKIAIDYYLGQKFNLGWGTQPSTCTQVEILENGSWVEITKESLKS